MEKIYKFILPQNKEVKKTNIRIENGEVFVDVEFKEKFQPKDGDFLVSSYGKVFIYSEKPAKDNSTYSAYCGESRIGNFHAEFSYQWTNKKGCRYATPEEKAAFLEGLEKECGKRWNEETKQLENIRWNVKKNELYYYVESWLTVDYSRNEQLTDELRIAMNNCYKTEEAAQKVADQIKDIFKNSKAE